MDELLALPGLGRYLATASASEKAATDQFGQALALIKPYVKTPTTRFGL